MSAGPDRPEHMEQETRLRALHELEQAELVRPGRMLQTHGQPR